MFDKILNHLEGQIVILNLDPGGQNWVSAILRSASKGWVLYHTADRERSVCIPIEIARIQSIVINRIYEQEYEYIITYFYPGETW